MLHFPGELLLIIQTDWGIQHRRSTIVIHKRKRRKTIIVDFTVPRDTKIAERKIEKKEKHQELTRETKVLPVVELKGCLEQIEFQTE